MWPFQELQTKAPSETSRDFVIRLRKENATKRLAIANKLFQISDDETTHAYLSSLTNGALIDIILYFQIKPPANSEPITETK